MRKPDNDILDPEIAASLDAIDATLAGDPVDPRFADIAELALLLGAERPQPDPDFALSLDRCVERRFAATPPVGDSAPATESPRPAPRRRWLWAPAAGLAVAVLVVIVVAAAGGGGKRPVFSSSTGAHAANGGAAALPAAPLRKPANSAASPTSAPPASTSSAPGASSSSAPGASSSSFPGLQLPQNDRKVVQSSQLVLGAAPDRIDDVAQEVFNVVGAENGYVDHSSVTATGGPSGYAEFQLTVPSATLTDTMTQLSQLRYAHVSSRTDNTSDVTGQFSSTSAQLAQAQALRTSLLKQLQGAVTQTQIQSLRAQLADVNQQISNAQSALRSLNRQVSYSQISVTVEAGAITPVRPVTSGGGFTLGKAAHDAGRVLTVAAGVALIALAVAVPLALIASLAWWVAAAVRRRRREQALDLG